ncbi:MAG TPA: glycoside-pentoside-hexuronide (GPH):cation symporter [Myxococcota bacterium]|nr:glycoside-pentoside-hexuronide (GPH):cation symporter [Myxococcota bacterium]
MTASAPQALRPRDRALYGLGDLTVNTVLSAMVLVYTTHFLTQVADLRPALAGLVPLVGRVVDAFFDPLMGRISDATRWQAGRRRPYLLIGALPFGASFALMWLVPACLVGPEHQTARFMYYVVAYGSAAIWMTVLSVPYLALLPEMALDYDERTTLSSWRNLGSTLGIFAALGVKPLAERLGGGPPGFAAAGAIVGALLVPPWLVVHRVTFERPGFRAQAAALSLREASRAVARNRPFRRLVALFLAGRFAMDVTGALMILFVSYWLGRPEAFEPVMLSFLATVVLSLPLWLGLARGREKSRIFIVATLWWAAAGLLFLLVRPDWPTAWVAALACLAGLGFSAVDLMPWAMLGEVIDADELESGERRDGLYNGFFTFLRKIAGAIGVFLVMAILDRAGFAKGESQSETVRQAIRWLTTAAPSLCLLVAAAWARGYPLTRAEHARIRTALEARRGRGEG